MTFWLTVIAAGLVTYATRASFIALGDRITLPTTVERALKYVAPAAFAGISIPLVLGGDGFADFSEDVPRIIAGLAVCIVAWRLKNLPLTLFVGMGILWLTMWVF